MMLSLLNCLLFTTVFATPPWIEYYLSNGIHRKLTANDSATYFTFAHPHSQVEVRKNLFWILDPCGNHDNVTAVTKSILCGDNRVKEFVGDSAQVAKMCSSSAVTADDAVDVRHHPGFELVYVGEETCSCSRTCLDGTVVQKWPACSCVKQTKIGFQFSACNFNDQCDWDHHEFHITPKKPNKTQYHIAVAIATKENKASMWSPFYSQFTSSCALSFYYNLAGAKTAEIRIYLEWRKYAAQTNTAEDVLLSTINVHQENGVVLDYHEVPIGFVTKHTRIRIECLVREGDRKGKCIFSNLTWVNCAEKDLLESKCHNHNNPTLCEKDGRTVCLDDVSCDGIKDCANGEDEEDCDFVPNIGSKCNFNNGSGMCGWEEKANPLRRDGKKFFMRGRLLPNLTLVDDENHLLEHGAMRETPRSDSENFLLISSAQYDQFDSREYFFESPLFPPTRQYTGDSNRPEESCTIRFRFCIKGSEQPFKLEIEKFAHMQQNSKMNVEPLWEPLSHQIAFGDRGTKCDWHSASVKIPRQLLPFRLRFSIRVIKGYPFPTVAVDDLSLNPVCFDYNSHTGVTYNQTFSTCGKTGADVPQYDDCRREAIHTGGSEVEVFSDGSRSVTIAKDGFFWVNLCAAAGGGFPSFPGKAGNCVAAKMQLVEGDRMKFFIGQKGASPCKDPTDTLSKLQEKVFNYVCGRDNTTNVANVDSALYIGAGGGGMSALYLPDGSIGMVVGGGGGAFPRVFKPRNALMSGFNGNGLSLRPHHDDNSCISDCLGATPKNIAEQGDCFKKAPFDTQGGYGGGGASCGTGGGGGAGYFGGKYGRFGSGATGSNYVNKVFSSAAVAYFDGVNTGDGSLTLVRCSLECDAPSICDFASLDNPEMTCSCGFNKVLFNGTCILREPIAAALEAGPELTHENWNITGRWVLGSILLTALVIVALLILRKNRYSCLKVLGKKHLKKNTDNNEDGMELLDVNHAETLERIFANQPFIKNLPNKNLLMLLNKIDNKDLIVFEPIGKGAFGNVCRGVLTEGDGKTREVAVKELNSESNDETEAVTRNFITEAILMSLSNNVGKATIQLLGVVLDKRPYKIVMELMKGGNLLNFLRSSRPNGICDNPNNLTMRDLIQFAKDIVEGCLILERNQHLHRDLAARNCLLTKLGPGRKVKIGDFGLATELMHTGEYVSRARQRPIPLKWMPPEAIQDGVFSTKTDVWSFGVVCWEIFTIGQVPYPAVPKDYMFDILAQGKRLAKPKGCPLEIYNDIMLECWQPHPEDRPTFAELDTRLDGFFTDIRITNLPIPLVYGLEKVSSPILEDPIFNPMVGTPVTIETALPTPLTTEDHWSSPDRTPCQEQLIQEPSVSCHQAFYQSPTPPVTTFQINNNSYWKGSCTPEKSTANMPERPTQLHLTGIKYRESLFTGT